MVLKQKMRKLTEELKPASHKYSPNPENCGNNKKVNINHANVSQVEVPDRKSIRPDRPRRKVPMSSPCFSLSFVSRSSLAQVSRSLARLSLVSRFLARLSRCLARLSLRSFVLSLWCVFMMYDICLCWFQLSWMSVKKKSYQKILIRSSFYS